MLPKDSEGRLLPPLLDKMLKAPHWLRMENSPPSQYTEHYRWLVGRCMTSKEPHSQALQYLSPSQLSVLPLTKQQPPSPWPGAQMACLLLLSQKKEVALVHEYLKTRIWLSILTPTGWMSLSKSPDLSQSQLPHTSRRHNYIPPRAPTNCTRVFELRKMPFAMCSSLSLGNHLLVC